MRDGHLLPPVYNPTRVWPTPSPASNITSCSAQNIGSHGSERRFRSAFWAYLGGIARDHELTPLLVGGVDDHVHLLLALPPKASVSEALKAIKGASSGWMKETFLGCRGFGWQDGYAAFTVSKSQVPEVQAYIGHQREHHRIKSFQEEYRALLDRHGIHYDERYLWD